MEIKTFKPEDHNIKALIYGGPGTGKTVFAGTAENALFLSAEAGLLSIKDLSPEYVEINTMKDLLDAYSFLLKGGHKYKTVIIDSITEISNTLKDEIEKRTGKPMQLQDWGEIKKKLIAIFKEFRNLPMNVILIAQESYINDEDKIRKIVPSLDGKGATSAIPYFMDIVGYMKVDIKGKRTISTNNSVKYVTKDRSGCIGDDCPADFSEWEKRVGKIKTGKEKTKEVKGAPEEPVKVESAASAPMLKKLMAKVKDLKELNDKCGSDFKSWG